MTALIVVGTLGLVVVLAGVLLGEVLDGALDAALPGDLGPGVTAAVGAAAAAFGFGTALALRAGELPAAGAYALGAVGALVVGAASFYAARAVIGAESRPSRSTDLYGVFGTVVSPIPASGYGQVVVHHDGTRLQLSARAEQPLVAGTAVYVLEIVSETAVVVAPAQPVLPTPQEGTT